MSLFSTLLFGTFATYNVTLDTTEVIRGIKGLEYFATMLDTTLVMLS